MLKPDRKPYSPEPRPASGPGVELRQEERNDDADTSVAPHATTKSDAERVVERGNLFAREVYRMMGCRVADGYRFDKSRHPQERLCWSIAVEAMNEFAGTDLEDAADILDDETADA